jgi:hypothetical protein
MENYRLLYYQPNTQTWKPVRLTGPSFSIGRAPENNLTLDDGEVSRRHASLHFDERGVWIMDENSANGVILNGLRIPAGEWIQLPLNTDITIGATTLRVEAAPGATFSSQPVIPAAGPRREPQPVPAVHRPARVAQPRKTGYSLPLLGVLGCLAVFVCLVTGGVAVYLFLPGQLPKQSITFEPPTVIDSLPASPGAGAVQDDKGVSLSVPADALEAGQLAHLERASLSQGMQTEIEKNYQVESLAYAAVIQDGQDGIGQLDLALPAKSPDSRLAVLVGDKWLGILETSAQDGVFHIGAYPSLGPVVQAYYGGKAQAPNRYLVLTPKTTSSQSLPGNVKLASYSADDSDGKSCITEFWTVNHCWRNPEGSVYVFWENDAPASLKDETYLSIINTVKAIASMMGTFQQNGFKSAAISASNPAYIVIEASATSPYYSWKTNNVYVPWDIVAGISDIQNRCTLAHEFMHWIEDEEYRMGTAAISGPKSWWMEVSADNAAFLLDSGCIEKNLTQYGIVNTSKNVLGFQAAPLQWESGEGARYIHSLQFYLSICEGGANCALSQAAWVEAINNGTYPMEGAAVAAYERNAKDLGRFLLGAAPAESRTTAVIPPSAISGNHFGDYLILRTSDKNIWDFGLTMNQFTQPTLGQVKVQANIAKGGVYPLWVSNGTRTPMGGSGGATGLPGLLEIQAGPAFWLKKDQAAPVFYPAGTSLKLAPISDKLGIGAARIVAVAPDGDQTFQANLSLADLSGDWSATQTTLQMTPLDCKSFSSDDSQKPGPDQLLQYFSGYGTYVKDTTLGQFSSDLIWQGTLPEGATGTSDVTVAADKIRLDLHVQIPEPADSGGSSSWLPWVKLGQGPARGPLQQPNALLSVSLALPLLGAALWLKRLRRKWAVRLALANLLLLGALLLSGCFGIGFSVWGTVDATYTFDKLEYIDPQQAADGSSGGAADQPTVIWRLTNGQATYNYDLIIQAETTDSDGKTTKEKTPCKLTATSNLSATIGPEGSVAPPK